MRIDNGALSKHQHHLDRINEELKGSLNPSVPLVGEMGRHAMLGKGKRLRPLIFVLCCHLCDYRGEIIYRLSSIFEYIHVSSLLHDDVLDNAETRRKRPSANKLWGNHAAVLEGDYLYAKSLAIALDSGNFQFLEMLTSTTMRMTEGQILELANTRKWDMTRQEYMEIITAKTAALIGAACGCAAVHSGVDSEHAGALERFGLNLGISFQLMDDLLDYSSTEEVFGKPVGKDLREGKVTLPLIYTLAGLEQGERARMTDALSTDTQDEAYLQGVIAQVRNNGALGKILAEAQAYVDEASQCLRIFPDSAVKDDLLMVGQYMVERDF